MKCTVVISNSVGFSYYYYIKLLSFIIAIAKIKVLQCHKSYRGSLTKTVK